MEIIQLTVNGFGENTYIVVEPMSKQCAIVDPGVSDSQEQKALTIAIDKYGLTPIHLINTHLHIDHVLGNTFVQKQYNLGLKAHKADEFLGQRVMEQAQMFGIPLQISAPKIETYLNDGDKIKIGEEELIVLSVPGHSPGSIALYSPTSHFVITGDALFAGSIGRADLPGGDFNTLINSIENKLLTLPDNTVVYPGHGRATTIGYEKIHNPYLNGF